jgi:hypothetical protein
MTLEEARFAIDAELVALAAENDGQMPPLRDVRFFYTLRPSVVLSSLVPSVPTVAGTFRCYSQRERGPRNVF